MLRNINFFDQRYTNLVNSSPDTIVDVLSQAGSRWVGTVPFDAEALKDSTQFGLIEIYETVFKRGSAPSCRESCPTTIFAVYGSIHSVSPLARS